MWSPVICKTKFCPVTAATELNVSIDTVLEVTVLRSYSSSREKLLYLHGAKQKVSRLFSTMFSVDFTPSEH